MRDRITLENPPEAEGTLNGLGEPEGNWSELATVWARVEDLGGDERHEVDQTSGFGAYTVRLRWLDGVTSQSRIVWGAKTLEVTGVSNPDGRKVELVLTARERRSG